ncbi:adenylosuccinate synthase [Sarracenia purpurea var. burkii]
MLSIEKWKCSWSLVATVASIVALISVVHLFLFPVVPSFDYTSARHAENYCMPLNGSIKGGKDNVVQNSRPVFNLDLRFPDDLHNAVVYHGAPWKAVIGRWLSGCDSIAAAVKVVEGKGALKDCTWTAIFQDPRTNHMGVGSSQYALPIVTQQEQCVSVAKALNTQTALLLRHVVLNLPSKPDGPKLTDWTKADLVNVFTTNGSKPGWCNVDPAEAYASKVLFKEECDCKYDCLWGRFCEVPVQCTCINQCSGHGHCLGGFCREEYGTILDEERSQREDLKSSLPG